MARVSGQIDVAKTEAILDAALDVFVERGVAAPMEEIARRAGVSKQTIYNHYGSKAELVQALTARRVHELVAPLETKEAVDDPETGLAGFARLLLGKALSDRSLAFFRVAMMGALEAPDLGQAVWEAGPRESRRRLAEFLEMETRAGRLDCPDPQEAAEFFAGMVVGSYQTSTLLGAAPRLDAARVDRIATEAARRFMRAYAPA